MAHAVSFVHWHKKKTELTGRFTGSHTGCPPDVAVTLQKGNVVRTVWGGNHRTARRRRNCPSDRQLPTPVALCRMRTMRRLLVLLALLGFHERAAAQDCAQLVVNHEYDIAADCHGITM